MLEEQDVHLARADDESSFLGHRPLGDPLHSRSHPAPSVRENMLDAGVVHDLF